MSYFVFDLDETLANLYSAYYYVSSLRLKSQLDTSIFPIELEKQLEHAYQLFVERILKEESNKPLGILRPGILQIMSSLLTLKKKGKIANVIIYSNNSSLESLEFIRDLIHTHINNKHLISDCVHWDHPLRTKEKLLYPGMYPKTWNTISEIILQKSSRIVRPKNVYFFDDLDHPDLQKTLQNNYYKVPPYEFKASVNRINAIYDSVLKDAKVDITNFCIYLFDVFPIYSTFFPLYQKGITHNNLLFIFSELTKKTASEHVIPEEDSAIDLINNAINKLKTKNKTKCRRRYTYKRSKL